MIQRIYLSNIEQWLWKEKIIILKWARQVWKTTLLKNIKENLEKWNNYCVYLDADNLNNSSIFNTPWDLIYYLELKHDLKNKDFMYIFIDEFQYIKNAWLFLKNLFDNYKTKIQIIASWSSSLEITKNTEFLTWRTIEFYIDRISFFEFFKYKTWVNKDKILLNDFEQIVKFYNLFKNDLEKYFLEYLSFWWYPEVVITDNENQKLDILNSIIKTYIEKDIANFLKIENITWFNNLIKLLSSQKWNLINQSELSATLWISRNTISKYLDIIKWTFIFNYIPPFFSNVRKEISKMPKVYCEDLWISSLVLWETFSLSNKIDLWSIVENFVYKALSQINNYNKLYYYRTIWWAEIDFILEDFEKNISLIEVKYRTKINRLKIFNDFIKNHNVKIKNQIIISKNTLSYSDWLFEIPACLFDLITINI